MYENLKKFSQNFLIDKNILRKISDLIPNNNLNILKLDLVMEDSLKQ